jgi:hypothetical protein
MHDLDKLWLSAVLRFLDQSVAYEHVGCEPRRGSEGWMPMTDLYYGYLRWALEQDELLLTGTQFGTLVKTVVQHRRDAKGVLYKARPKRADWLPAPRKDIVGMHRAAVDKRTRLRRSNGPPADGTQAQVAPDGTGGAS